MKSIPLSGLWSMALIGAMAFVVDGKCAFPDYLWKARKPWIRKAVTEPGIALNKTYLSYHEWNFGTDSHSVEVMEVHPQRIFEGSHISLKNYTCLEEFADNLFLVRDRSAGLSRDRLLCLKFIKRSFFVVQLATGEEYYEKTRPNCEYQDLYLDPLLLLYYHENILSEVPLEEFIQECPLTGGYDVKIYSEEGVPFCDSYPPVRLENDCWPGAGLKFRTFSNDCSLGQSEEHTFYCIATWKSHGFDFLVARPQYYFSWNAAVITMRIQRSISKGKMKAIISTDLICNHELAGAYRETFFEAVLRNYVIADPCSDITPECSRINPKLCTRHQQETCVKTCEFCPPNRVWESFAMPPSFQGKWLKQTYEGGKETIHIDKRVVSIPSVGKIEIMGKSECRRPWIKGDDRDYLGIVSFKNGCAPKLMGLMMSRQNGSVLSMRVSQPSEIVINPFGYDFLFLWPYWCAHIDYGLDTDNPQLRDRYWSAERGWFNMVAIGGKSNASHCYLPEDLHHAEIQQLEYTGDTRYTCDGKLHVETNYSFVVQRDMCRFADNSTFSVRSLHYTCLSFFDDSENRHYLILRVGSYHGLTTNFQCWIFSEHNSTDEYIINVFPAGSCDPVSLTRADHEPVSKVIKLTTLPPPTEGNPTGEAVLSARDSCPTCQTQVEHMYIYLHLIFLFLILNHFFLIGF